MARHPPLLLLLLHGACFAPVGNGADTPASSSTATTGETPDDTTAIATATSDASTDPTPTTGIIDPTQRSCTWSQIGLDGPPPARFAHSIDLEPMGALIMFAGRDFATETNYDDVWQYTDKWVDITPTDAGLRPSPRRGFAAAIHPTLGLIVFGGDDGNGSTNLPAETWAFRGDKWTQLSADPSPPVRSFATMEYHPDSDSVIMFGGNDLQGNVVPGTWALNKAGKWTELMGASPQARVFHTMARDADGDLIMHGGCAMNTSCTAKLDDTWRWTQDKWQMLDPGSKASHAGGVMTRATADGTLFRFIGGATNIEAYEWKDEAWVPLQNASANPPITMEKFAADYHPDSDAVILFGGLRMDNSNAETWSFRCDA